MRQRRGASQKTILHWYAPTAQCIAKTAEERFNMLARGWLAYPVTPVAHATTAEERLQKYHRHIGIAAERRHFSNPVRGAKRMRAGILRILPISRAGGTQLAKIIFRDLYNRSSAVDSSSATDPR